jgi:nicotinate-nucleotide adenylyltransferase
MRRIGLFGGTFDPPHLGHLAIAERARECLRLDQVIFMPSGTPPHKRGAEISRAAARVAMTRLAVRDHPAFTLDTLETRRRGASYTVDTLRTLRAQHPRARLYLVIGEDSLEEFHTWHEPESILALATLVVAPRPEEGRARGRLSGGASVASKRAGSRRLERGAARRVGRGLGAARFPGLRRRVVWLDGPRLELSSSQIRARVRAGRSVRYLVPERVAGYLARHRLYGRRR